MYLTLWYLVFGKLIIFWFRTMLIIVPWVIKFNLKSLLSAWIFARFLSQTICLVSHNADHSAVGHKSQFKVVKVHIFWEGHTILRNLGQLFDWQYIHRTKNWWRFRKILWLSQNIWTLLSAWIFARFLSQTIT